MDNAFFAKHFKGLFEPLQPKLRMGYWAFTVDSGELEWSDGVYAIHGLDADEYQPTVGSALSFYISEDQERIGALLGLLQDRGGDFDENFRIRRADGKVIRVRVLGYMGSSAHGDNVIFGVIQDIEAEARAAHESEMLSAVARRTNEGILVTDPAGHIVWANEGIMKLTGYSLDELLGKRPGDLLQGEDTDTQTAREIRSALDEKRPIQIEILNYHKNGTPYWLKLDIQPYFSDGGALKYYLAVETDITAQYKEMERLSKQVRRKDDERRILEEESYTDDLTRVGNRKYLRKVWKDLTANPSNQNIAVFALDIDHFKSVNDNFGHDMGDKVLVQFANTISEMLREGDFFFRIGGEEFCVVVDAVMQKGALQIAERFREKVEGQRVDTGDGQTIPLTVSIGVALWERIVSGFNEDLDSILKRADIALYQAKDEGRNRVCINQPQAGRHNRRIS